MNNNLIINLFNKIMNSFGFVTNQNIELEKNLQIKLLKSEPKIWNMDTSIFTIVNNFYNKIFNIYINECRDFNNVLDFFNFFYIKKTNENNDKKKERFILECNNIDITPTSKKDSPEVALNTMGQYLRILNFLNIIIIDVKNSLKNDTVYNIVSNQFVINIGIDFLNFLLCDDLKKWFSIDKLLSFIVDGIKKEIKGFKDMAFSIFINLIYFLDTKKVIFNDENLTIKRIKFIKNKQNQKYTFIETIKKSFKETYSGIISCFVDSLKVHYGEECEELLYETLNLIFSKLYSEKIINDIQISKNSPELGYWFEQMKEQLELENKIKNSRAKLRKNILKNRNINDDPYYSDIEPIKQNEKFIHDCIEQQEAAHILAVNEIKQNIKDNIDYLYELSDPNNGILMDHTYHDAFDRGWISFDIKGHMIARDEWKKRYIDNNGNYIKYPLMKIKNDVYNQTMKQYFEKKKNKYNNKKQNI